LRIVAIVHVKTPFIVERYVITKRLNE